MHNKPIFNNIKSFNEFKMYYWYLSDLKEICKQINIEYIGSKKDLYNYIEEYYKGNIIIHKKIKKNYTQYNKELTLDTKVLECNYAFNQKFRDFFSTQTNIKNFKFNTDMTASVRKVKETNDSEFTLQDLLDIFYKKKEYAKHDKSYCQWNKFLKDFSNDDDSKNYTNKFEVARILWNEVRNSLQDKAYSNQLLNKYKNKIIKYLIMGEK